MELKFENVLVKYSSGKARVWTTKGGKTFPTGKGFKVSLGNETKDNKLINQIKDFKAKLAEKLAETFPDLPEFEIGRGYAFDTVDGKKTKEAILSFDLTKVRTQNGEVLKNDDDTLREYCVYEINKLPKPKFINTKGEVGNFAPFAGDVVDIVFEIQPKLDKAEMKAILSPVLKECTIKQLGNDRKPSSGGTTTKSGKYEVFNFDVESKEQTANAEEPDVNATDGDELEGLFK